MSIENDCTLQKLVYIYIIYRINMGDAKCQGAWAPATWPMLSTRTSKETLVHWSNRQVWIASWGCQFSTPIPMCVFTLAWIWSQRIYWYEVRTLSRLKQNSVSNVWNSWELPGQALSVLSLHNQEMHQSWSLGISLWGHLLHEKRYSSPSKLD